MRTKKIMINSFIALLQNYLTLILSFICRTVFIHTLGSNYLGVNGLFSDIFNMLSLMELGIGSAITYYLYAPIAENNRSKITQILNLYRKLYNIIGLLILVVGLLIIPLLPYVIKDYYAIDNIIIIYILMLFNVVGSYFFAYKRALLEADQKSYINSLNLLKVNIIKNVANIFVLIFTYNYYLYLIINIICTLYSNISISRKIDKLYPYILNSVDKIDSLETKKIFSRARALLCHKIGSVVVFGTDNILLSTVASFKFIGVYSNYIMIINMINAPLNQIFNSLTSSIGNISVIEDDKTSKDLFDKVFFVNFWLVSFCSIALFTLINPFIDIWLNESFVLPYSIVFVIVLNFYITGIRNSANYFDLARGLFWNTRIKPIIESVLNIILSLIFIHFFGVIGIMIGTTASSILTSLWVEPYVLFKNWFKTSVWNYFLKLIIYTFCTILFGSITFLFCHYIFFINSLFTFIIKIIAVCIIPNLLIILFYRNSSEFKYIFEKIKIIYSRKWR